MEWWKRRMQAAKDAPARKQRAAAVKAMERLEAETQKVMAPEMWSPERAEEHIRMLVYPQPNPRQYRLNKKPNEMRQHPALVPFCQRSPTHRYTSDGGFLYREVELTYKRSYNYAVRPRDVAIIHNKPPSGQFLSVPQGLPVLVDNWHISEKP